MNMEVERFEVDGKTVVIYYDEFAPNPRTESDNLGTILYKSRDYMLGDKQATDEEMNEIANRKDVIWLPVYAYIHSGVTIRTGSFSCPWDSGLCGLIYIEKERVLKEYGAKIVHKKLKELVERVLKGEIETFDQYLTGDVYRFDVLDEDGEVIDSLNGVFGLEYCREEARAMAENTTVGV